MAHKHNFPGQPFIVLDDDGYLLFYTQEGQVVSNNIFLRLDENVDGPNTVIGKFFVNIVKDKEEMMSEIEKYKKSFYGI